MKRLPWLLAGLLLLAACESPASGPGPSPSASASPAPSASATAGPTSPPAASCSPQRGGTDFAAPMRPAITDVRVGANSDYDRLVIEFTNPGVPVYDVAPNPTTPPGGTSFVEDPRGTSVTVDGSYGFQVKLSGLDWLSDRYPGGRDLKPGYPMLREVRVVGDNEAIVHIAIGLRAAACPTVTRMTSPPRLVIDFPLT